MNQELAEDRIRKYYSKSTTLSTATGGPNISVQNYKTGKLQIKNTEVKTVPGTVFTSVYHTPGKSRQLINRSENYVHPIPQKVIFDIK